MPDDSPIPGRDVEELALHGPVLSTVKSGGPKLTVGSTTFELVVSMGTLGTLRGRPIAYDAAERFVSSRQFSTPIRIGGGAVFA